MSSSGPDNSPCGYQPLTSYYLGAKVIILTPGVAVYLPYHSAPCHRADEIGRDKYIKEYNAGSGTLFNRITWFSLNWLIGVICNRGYLKPKYHTEKRPSQGLNSNDISLMDDNPIYRTIL